VARIYLIIELAQVSCDDISDDIHCQQVKSGGDVSLDMAPDMMCKISVGQVYILNA
jgi:hypothetical protein